MKKLLSSILIVALVYGCKSADVVKEEKTEAEIVNNEKAMNYFLDASMYEMKGEYDKAIINYQRSLELEENAGIHFALGKNYLRLGKIIPALRHAKKAAAMDSTNLDYELLLGESFNRANLRDSANIVFQKILRNDSTNTQALISLANNYEKDKPLQALSLYKKLLELNGPDWNILLKIATINEKLGNDEETIKTIETLVEKNPSGLDIKKLLIELYLRNNKNNKALELIKETEKSFPDDVALKEYKAKVYWNSKNYKKSLECYLPLISDKNTKLKAKVGVAGMFFNQIPYDTTLMKPTLEMLYSIDKDTANWQIKSYIAELNLLKQNDSLGIKYLKEAAHLADWNSRLWIRLGGLLFDSGRTDEAIEEMKTAVEKFPDEFVINIVLGLSYAQKNKTKEAKPYLEKSVNLNPTDFTSNMAYGFVLHQLEKSDSALIYLNNALEMNPNSVQVLSTLGMIYDDKEDWAKCFDYYERALKIDSTNATIMNNYAYSLSKKEVRLDYALELAKKAVSKEPENSSFLDTIGWVYYKLGKYNKAIEFLKKAEKQDSKSVEIKEHLGDVYLKLNKKEKAKEYWKKALDLDKDNVKLKKKLEEGV